MAFVIPDRNAVIVPGSRVGSCKEFEVYPYTVPTFRALRLHGVNLPGPIRTEYGFESRFEAPLHHQVLTADYLTQMRKAFVLNDIGTCKTLSALWAADYLMELGLIRSVLICSTLSTLQRVWADEIFKTLSPKRRTYTILHGSKSTRLKRLKERHDYYIINHDGVKVLANWDRSDPELSVIKKSEFDAASHIDLVVVDECAVLRNRRTDLYRAMEHITKHRMLWMMSGSPMPRAPTDMWAQARLVCPDRVPRSFVRFRRMVMDQKGQFLWRPKQGWAQIVRDIIGPYCIRFTRDKCVDLPPRIVEKLESKLSKQQQKAYNEMAESCISILESGSVTAVNKAVMLGKLLQISCGVLYNDEEVHLLDCKQKLDDLKALAEQAGRKLIVFVPFKAAVEMVYKALKTEFKTCFIMSSVSVSKRNQYFYDFQEGELEIIVAHPKCMAHGINLTKAHTVAWFSPINDLDVYGQASGRISRPGQKCVQTIVHMISSKIEAKVFEALELKQSTQDILLDLLTRR